MATAKERTSELVSDAYGTKSKDPTKILRWERDNGRAMKRSEIKGYVQAHEDDVAENEHGYKTADGSIRRGDLVLMVGDRAAAEEREAKRVRDTMSMDERAEQIEDEKGGLERRSGHGKSRGGKFYSIP